MTEFTRGEWWVRDCSTNGVPGYEICWSPEEECVTDHVYERADAFLMAASKEMYAALDGISRGEGLPPGTTIEGILAKARGETA